MEAGQEAQLRFRRAQAGADSIQEVVDEIVAELGDPTSEASERARAADLDPDDLASASVAVTEEGQGVEPITTILVTVAGGVAIHIATKFWDEVIWPRLRRRLGGQAVGDKI